VIYKMIYKILFSLLFCYNNNSVKRETIEQIVLYVKFTFVPLF